MMMFLKAQSTPSPLRGGIKGAGRESGYPGSQGPLPIFPIAGEVPSGELGKIKIHRTNDINFRETSHG